MLALSGTPTCSAPCPRTPYPSQRLMQSLGQSRAGMLKLHCLPCRCRQYSSLRLPLMYSHPYSQITVETEFDNPIYETGVSGVTYCSPGGPPP